jgi:hypothetical protein
MNESIADHPKRPGEMPWAYTLCSFLPLLFYALVVGTWQRHHRTGWTTDLTGVLFGALIALNCIWWFLRCPRQHGIAKGITFLLMVVAILEALSHGYSNLAYRLYGS